MDIYDTYFTYDSSIYELYHYYCTRKIWAFMILITSVYDPLDYDLYDSHTQEYVLLLKQKMTCRVIGLRLLLHSENLVTYDPFFTYDPSNYGLYHYYCTRKIWTFMILITSTGICDPLDSDLYDPKRIYLH